MSTQGFIQPDFVKKDIKPVDYSSETINQVGDQYAVKEESQGFSLKSTWDNHKKIIMAVAIIVIILIIGVIVYNKYGKKEKTDNKQPPPQSPNNAPQPPNNAPQPPNNAPQPPPNNAPQPPPQKPNDPPSEPRVNHETPSHESLIETIDDKDLDEFINPNDSKLDYDDEIDESGEGDNDDTPKVESIDE